MNPAPDPPRGEEPPDPWQPTPRPPAPPSDAQARYALGLDPPRRHGPYPPGPPGHPGPHPARLVLAWLIILLCTVTIAVLQSRGMKQMQEDVALDPRPGFNALYLARYAVGMEQLMKGQGAQMLPVFHDATAGSPHVMENESRTLILAHEVGDATQVARALDDHRLSMWQAAGRTPPAVTAQQPARPPSGHQPRADPALTDALLVHRIYTDGYTPTDAERDGLVERHGWFGRVAATYNLPRQDTHRQAPRNSGVRVVLGIVGIIGLLVLAMGVGLVLLIVLIVLAAARKLPVRGPAGPAGHRSAYVEATALFLFLFIALSLVLGLVQGWAGVDMMPVMLVGVIPALFWPLLMGVPWARFKADMGYHTGAGLFRELGAGFVGYLAGLPIIAVGFGITFVVTMFSEATADHPMQYELLEGGAYKLWLSLGAAVIWAPLVEESVFRAGLYRHLRQWRGVGGVLLAAVLTSFIFAAIHPQGYVGVPVLMSIAIVLALLREWRGSIIPSMVAHGIHNTGVSVMLGIILFA